MIIDKKFRPDGTVESFVALDPTTGEPFVAPGEALSLYEQAQPLDNPMMMQGGQGGGDMAPGPVAPPPMEPDVGAPSPVAPGPAVVEAPPTMTAPEAPGMASPPGFVGSGPIAEPAPVFADSAPVGPSIVELQDTKKSSAGRTEVDHGDPVLRGMVDEYRALGKELSKAGEEAEIAKFNLQTAKATAESNMLADEAAAIAERKAAFQREQDERLEQLNRDTDALATARIDTNRLWANASTGDRVVAGIALALGAVGSAFSGKDNPVLKMMDDDIRRDIDAQKAAFVNKEAGIKAKAGLVKDFAAQYGDMEVASQAAYATAWKSVAANFEAIANATSNPIAKQNAIRNQMDSLAKAMDAQKAGAASKKSVFESRTEVGTGQQIPKASEGIRAPESWITETGRAAEIRLMTAKLLEADPASQEAGLGPIDSRINNIKRKLGISVDSQEQADMTERSELRNTVRHALFGTSLTENEAAAFEQYFPPETVDWRTMEASIRAIHDAAAHKEAARREGYKHATNMPNYVPSGTEIKNRDRERGFKPQK